MSFAFEKTAHISLSYKLVPAQFRKYEYGILVYLSSYIDAYCPNSNMWRTTVGVIRQVFAELVEHAAPG